MLKPATAKENHMSDETLDVEEREGPPQAPGDEGYEAPAIIPELDLEGGTVFKVGEDEYGSMEEAQDALTPDEEVPEPEPEPEPEP